MRNSAFLYILPQSGISLNAVWPAVIIETWTVYLHSTWFSCKCRFEYTVPNTSLHTYWLFSHVFCSTCLLLRWKKRPLLFSVTGRKSTCGVIKFIYTPTRKPPGGLTFSYIRQAPDIFLSSLLVPCLSLSPFDNVPFSSFYFDYSAKEEFLSLKTFWESRYKPPLWNFFWKFSNKFETYEILDYNPV